MKNQRAAPRPADGPRRIAWRILSSWKPGSASLESLRENHLNRSKPDPRDRALIMELTQGTARHLTLIDHTIRSCLDRPDRKLPGPVLAAVRLGTHQLLYLSRIPDHAAVQETVEIIKRSRYRKFAPLVNAVLRRIAKNGPAPVPAFEADALAHIETVTSTPRWIVEHFTLSLGTEETLSLLTALNRVPPLTLRINSERVTRDRLLAKLAKEGVRARAGKLSPAAVVLEDRDPVQGVAAFREGLCTVQDEGAQLIAPLLDPVPGSRILDACSAPGGKATHLAELTAGRGLIAAADSSRKRLLMMSENVRRLGAGSVRPVAADLAAALSPLRESVFDRVLLDAPCSGTGVFRRHPEGKWKKDPSAIPRMTGVQLDLLVSVSRALKPGGLLLYTTCSLLDEENERVVDRFLVSEGRMFRTDLRQRFPDMRRDVFTDRGELRLWPHIHDCDGFFASLLEKR